jgi:hypothetical protein
MNNPTWDEAFTHQLQALLSLTPADIRFPWANFRIQGYSPSDAIAYLIQTQRLYPELGLLPMPPPKYGMGEAFVWNGKDDRIVAARRWQALDEHWSYRTENSFGFGARSNVWFEEKGLEAIAEAPKREFCRSIVGETPTDGH